MGITLGRRGGACRVQQGVEGRVYARGKANGSGGGESGF